MLHARLLWKLYAGYSALLLLFAIIVGGLIARQIESDALAEIRQSLRARTILLRALAMDSLTRTEPKGDLALQDRVHKLGAEINTRLTIVRAGGKVVADSSQSPAEMDNHASRPEILAAQADEFGIATRYSHTLKINMMYIAVAVKQGGVTRGFVRASLPLSVVDERLQHLRIAILLGVGIAGITALLIGFIVARHFVNSLVTMTTVAAAMSRGDYSQRVSTNRADEIGTLARALNRMAESSRQRMDMMATDRNKLFSILAGMVEGVVAVDHDQRVVHMNLAAEQFLQTTTAECVGKPIWEVTRVRGVCEALEAAIRGAAEVRRRTQFPAAGLSRVIEVHASPLRDGQGVQVGAVIVLHDVTDLERLQTIRRDFVANASHELKTPLTAILGFVDILVQDADTPAATRQRFLARIQTQAVRLSALVSDLLALSRFEASGTINEREVLDLLPVIRQTVAAYRVAADDQRISLLTEFPATPVRLAGDEDALGQAMANLLDNAIKYTPAGGEIHVRVSPQESVVLIEIEDSGIGIASEDQERIFERFYRVDKARSRELGGTGLGLAIVRHVILTHAGRITLDSELDRGSRFCITLPTTPSRQT